MMHCHHHRCHRDSAIAPFFNSLVALASLILDNDKSTCSSALNWWLCCQKSSNRCRMTCTASRLLLPDQDKSSVSQNRGQQKQLAQHTGTMNGLKVPVPTPRLVPDCLKLNTEVENAQAIQRKPASDGKCIETVLSRIKMWNYVKFVPKRNVLMDSCCRLLGAGYWLHWWPLWQPQTPPAK